MSMVTKLVKVMHTARSFNPFIHMILNLGCLVKIHMSVCRRPMDIALSKVLTYHKKLPPLKPQDPLIMRST